MAVVANAEATVLRFVLVRRSDRQSFVLLLYWLFTVAALGIQYAGLDEGDVPAGGAHRSPEAGANFFSAISFWWLTPLMVLGYRKPLEMEDLWELDRDEAIDAIAAMFEREWARERRRARPSLSWALARAFGRPFMFAAALKLMQDVLAFVQPLLLQQLLNFIASFAQDDPLAVEPMYWGYLIAVAMFVTAVSQTLLLHQYFHRCFMTGMRIRSAIVTTVYRKALRLSNDARQKSTVGEIVNHMSIDAQKLMDLMAYLHILWSGPLQIALALLFLYNTLGPSIFAGFGVMVILLPINIWSALLIKAAAKRQMKAKDHRIKLMDEILAGMKVIKLYAWEQSFMRKVALVRTEEMSALRTAILYNAVQALVWTSAPFLVAIASFAVYTVALQQPLASEQAFVCLALFNLLQFPLVMFPTVISSVVEARVAVKRLCKYLLAEELDSAAVVRIHQHGSHNDDDDDDDDDGETSGNVRVATTKPPRTWWSSLFRPNQAADKDESASRGRAFELLPATDSASNGEAPSLRQAQNADADDDDDDRRMLAAVRADAVATVPVGSIQITRGTFRWSQEATGDTLHDISLQVRPGELVAVVGQVGSGKSSIVSAILGDTRRQSGAVVVSGRLAYVPQQAWIMNASVETNITFGRPMDRARYEAALEACALLPDLAILPAGDQTEIGEKGINLSGGQKQRVSLARAVFAQADVYLLDDPLSAVDAHVSRHLLRRVIGRRGLLRQAGRLLVTHSLLALPECDRIYVVQNGCIAEAGSYAELMAAQNGLFRLVEEYGAKGATAAVPAADDDADQDDTNEAEDQVPAAAGANDGPPMLGTTERRAPAPALGAPSALAAPTGGTEGGSGDALGPATPSVKVDAPHSGSTSRLIEKETTERGNVSFAVYRNYFQAMGWLPVAALLLFLVVSQVAQIGSSLWLAYWSAQDSNNDIHLYLGVYAVLGIAQSGFQITYMLMAIAVCGLAAARKMHDRMLDTVMRAPMLFFDTTPLGRIVNRFSKDQNTVDEALPRAFQSYMRQFASVMTIFVVISYSTPIFLAAIVPLGVAYFFVQRYYVATAREIRRLDSVSRSPIFAHFSETLNGVSTIRFQSWCASSAFGQQVRFMHENATRLDINQRAYYVSIAANRWLAVRLEFVGSLVVFFSAMFAVIAHGSISPSIAGLSVSYALSITQSLNWMVRMACDIEANIVAVERIIEYTDLAVEAPHENPVTRPAIGWPDHGQIAAFGYSTRYRPGLDLVLRDITFAAAPQQKIGVVGRTGAGKSSLALAMFRILEAASGRIEIDRLDIAPLGLHDLRSRLSIIPQDPVLFSGTIRDNLDPFAEHDDDALWLSLEHASLKPYVSSLAQKLDSPVVQGTASANGGLQPHASPSRGTALTAVLPGRCSGGEPMGRPGGENFSVGQRQLVCLARALLRRSSVLVLDEATAACDVETDNFIQQTIRTQFASTTVLTIAHRLSTVRDADLILVLDRGRVVEAGTHDALMAAGGSYHALVLSRH